MSERGRAFAHFARGVEELLRAGAEALASLRERAASSPPSALEQALGRLADDAAAWVARGGGEARGALRAALERERMRWEFRAASDPAAERLRDLCEALLDLLDEPGESPPERAPRSASANAPHRARRRAH
jgi:hypothetical protein